MFPIRELVELIIQTLPMYVRRPELAMVVGVVIFLVYRQYARVALMEERLLGRPKASPARRTVEAMAYGLVGGLIGTALFIFLGLSLSDMGIWYLWPVALLLLLLHPRFICFAYAGGIVSLVHLATGFPSGVHVPGIMALVAILHLVESILIWWHGHRGATPVYVRRGVGQVVGGFTLQKFWPLPFVAMMTAVVPEQWAGQEELLSMPDWWPLIASPITVPDGFQLVYFLFPVVAALGYGDIAIVHTPRQKARRSALTLSVYSVVLMGLAVLSHHVPPVAWLAALFSPLGHEGVIWWGRRMEERGTPLYASVSHPTVLDVLPGSEADRLGLRPGDRFVHVNGRPVTSKAAVYAALLDGYGPRYPGWGGGGVWRPGVGAPTALEWQVGGRPMVEAIVERDGEAPRRIRWDGRTPLPEGVVLVPESYESPSVDLQDRSRYARIVGRIRRWIGSGAK